MLPAPGDAQYASARLTANGDAAAIDERLGYQWRRYSLDVGQCPIGPFDCLGFGAGVPFLVQAFRAAPAAAGRRDHRPAPRHEPVRDYLGIVRAFEEPRTVMKDEGWKRPVAHGLVGDRAEFDGRAVDRDRRRALFL